MTPSGFPHSETAGSKPAYGSPALIAVNYVFRRFRMPRHPSYALSSLFIELNEHPKIYPYAIVKEQGRGKSRYRNRFCF